MTARLPTCRPRLESPGESVVESLVERVAPAGDLDPTFGTEGVVRTAIGVPGVRLERRTRITC